MVRMLRAIAWPVVLSVALVLGAGGCPPNYNYFESDPGWVYFDDTIESFDLKISRAFETQSDPTFQVSNGGTEWFHIKPDQGSSTGPNDWTKFTITVDRRKLKAGDSTSEIIVTADDAITRQIEVTASRAVAADFSATPRVVKAFEEVSFTDKSTAAPVWGGIYWWTWDFGDGSEPSIEQNPKHAYTKIGKYTVSLTARTISPSETVVKKNYIEVVASDAPKADFVASNTAPPANTPVQFTDLSIGPGGIVSWLWTFGDDTSSTEMNPSHVYTAASMYTVSLTVTDIYGGTDTKTKTNYIDVQHVGPTANFVGTPRTVSAGVNVNFTDLSDPGNLPITAWHWFFGDGVTSSLQNPSHPYAAAGRYSVTLTVWNATGQDSHTKVDYITVTP